MLVVPRLTHALRHFSDNMEKYKTHMVYLKGKGETVADEKRRIKKIKTLAERIGKTKSGAVRLMIDAYEMKE